MKIYSHEKQKLHHPKSYFSRGQMRQPQETPERLTELLKAPQIMGLEVTTAKEIGIEPILVVHDFDYVEFLKHGYEEWMASGEDMGEEVQTTVYVPNNNSGLGILAKAAKYQADGSAPIGKHSWTSIYWSAQTALNAADSLLNDEMHQNDIQICLTRPAGHHARKSAAGGFCYLNNAAIIAEHLRQKFQKIAILDTDMHHGQGIQEIFYDRKDVLYTSVHGSPINFYPVVAGHEHERGHGNGYGYNVNFPMPHGTDEVGFFHYVDKSIEIVKLFNPDVVVHVLGFDVYKDDPQAKCHVSTQGFKTLAKKLKALNKPVIVLVEGGYCIEKLNENLQAFLSGLISKD
ncbi:MULTISPECIES: histone deacetylase family protein [unclassified Marinobacter]|uniref:histone deacetylase family protein n=1 Tax=unclassified Marinobacter TaxID=83889 RepID=UPI00200F5C48|nr:MULTISPECIES: histone deacetylase family protein [unclassified Marinobacter]UQG58158.1 histone deacetylase family protein [Marinobacter sp. M4C]UQG66963.1 histone deacetylase family protein [Marinobacter sp. M2C]UQG71244.1 histone deacetylase family protein [Marinobacter sp. M1C]